VISKHPPSTIRRNYILDFTFQTLLNLGEYLATKYPKRTFLLVLYKVLSPDFQFEYYSILGGTGLPNCPGESPNSGASQADCIFFRDCKARGVAGSPLSQVPLWPPSIFLPPTTITCIPFPYPPLLYSRNQRVPGLPPQAYFGLLISFLILLFILS